MEPTNKKIEALEWLKNNGNPSALATNRFGETVHAVAFVEMLYGLGAVTVSVSDIWDEPERIAAEGGPYASSLIVELPPDLKKREELIKIYLKEMDIHGLDDHDHEEFHPGDGNHLDFWWD